MGVTGLWTILDSTGHPIKLEAFEGKRIAVDANVWLYKFVRGFREKESASKIDGYKLGLFKRLCMLLFYKIKPIFIFDGVAPVLKQKTLERRKDDRNKVIDKARQTVRSKIIAELKALNPHIKINSSGFNIPQLRSDLLVFNDKWSEDTECYKKAQNSAKLDSQISSSSSSSSEFEEVNIKPFTHITGIDSEVFKELPAEVRHEILADAQASLKKMKTEALPEEAEDFSKFQFDRLLQRRSMQEKIEECRNEIQSSVGVLRVQSDPSAEIIFTKNVIFREPYAPVVESTSQIHEDNKMRPLIGSIRNRVNSQQNKNPQKQFNIMNKSPTKPQPVLDVSLSPDSEPEIESIEPKSKTSSEVVISDDADSDDTECYNDQDVVNISSESDSESLDIIPNQTLKRSSLTLSPKLSTPTHEGFEDRKTLAKKMKIDDVRYSASSKIDKLEKKKTVQGENKEAMHDLLLSPIEVIHIESSPVSNSEEAFSSLDELVYLDEDIVKIPKRSLDSKVTQEDESTTVSKDSLNLDFDKPKESVKEVPPVSISESSEDDEDDEVIAVENKGQKQNKSPDKNQNKGLNYSAEESPSGTQTSVSSNKFIQEIHDHIEGTQVNLQRARTVNQKIYEECQELLQMFGVPYLVAPSEAEAQCAFLEQIGMTEGTITDDSDIWLFGAKTVYRNFFSNKKFITRYKMSDIVQHLKLTREQLICYAMLVGSDYTDGISGIGQVKAIDILSEFEGEGIECLVNFKDWHESVNKDSSTVDKKFEKLIKINIPDSFPAKHVYESYTKPMVDTSEERFSWALPDEKELLDYAKREFGWNDKRAKQVLEPVMKKLIPAKSQGTMFDYLKKVNN